jgi:hypothetical protein
VFYTYAHYTPEGRLFYIGKGNGSRAHSHHGRNSYWKNVVKKYGNPDVQILANWETEEEAFSHEVLLISCFKDLGHKLCNLSNGGEGPSGLKHSEEFKEKLRVRHTGNTWRKGFTHSEERKQKISEFFKGSAYTIGNTNARKYMWIGTNIKTNKQINFIGSVALNDAGFNHSNVIKCINGERKTHKGYTWQKESLETKQCH